MASSLPAPLPSLAKWVQQQLDDQHVTLQPLYGDASHRRYFRVKNKQQTYVLADASVEKTTLPVFIAIDHALLEQGIIVPEIYAYDLLQGYLLQTDLGDVTLHSILNAKNVDKFYQQAFVNLLKMQACYTLPRQYLPHYDTTLITRELYIFTNWFLQKYHGLAPQSYTVLAENLLQIFLTVFAEQPQVFVHRDYHSRNLMVLPDQQLAIIDFQGAVQGPITYDLVSLLKDCYIDWLADQVQQWALQMQTQLWQQLKLTPVSEATFLRWFHLTGLQRHLKVLGQFARKAIAAKNTSYLPDMPRVLNYVLTVCAHFSELAELKKLLQDLPCTR